VKPGAAAAPAEGLKLQDILRRNFIPIISVIGIGFLAVLLIYYLVTWTGRYMNAADLYSMGLREIDKHNYDQSEKYFQRAMDLSPSIVKCNEYADKYIKHRLYFYAEKKYKQALVLDKKDFTTLLNHAKLYVYWDKFKQAEQKFSHLTNVYPKKNNNLIKDNMGVMYLHWGRTDTERLEKALDIYDKLLSREEENLRYMAKKMEVKVLQNKFYDTKKLQQQIEAYDPRYVEKTAFSELLHFYIDLYKEAYKNEIKFEQYKDKKVNLNDNEQLYMVRTIDSVIANLFAKDSNYIWNYYESARWYDLLGEKKRALYYANQGIKKFEKTFQVNKLFNHGRLYDIQGKLHLEQDNIQKAIEAFKESIEIDSYNPMPYYYLGKINLEEIGNISKAKENFNNAILNWRGRKTAEYLSLLHQTAYTYYYHSLNNDNDVKADLRKSLNYWKELQDITGGNYFLDYLIGNTYLRLNDYHLAESKYRGCMGQLKKYMAVYEYNRGNVDKYITDRIEVLSDLYNNIAVARMGQAFSRDKPYQNRKLALKYLADSINMKDKLSGIRKSIPQVNFARLHNQQLQNTDKLKIADDFMLRSKKFVYF
ncbi:MAG TPA: hypothetical protein VKS21_01180, partial [Spirochaetota bacterium]|nr:hypothetical protein [Spirochaetota bacterium]